MYLINITAAEVLLKKELYLLHKVLDGAGASPHPPHIVQTDHAVLHAQKILCAAQRFARLGALHMPLKKLVIFKTKAYTINLYSYP